MNLLTVLVLLASPTHSFADSQFHDCDRSINGIQLEVQVGPMMEEAPEVFAIYKDREYQLEPWLETSGWRHRQGNGQIRPYYGINLTGYWQEGLYDLKMVTKKSYTRLRDIEVKCQDGEIQIQRFVVELDDGNEGQKEGFEYYPLDVLDLDPIGKLFIKDTASGFGWFRDAPETVYDSITVLPYYMVQEGRVTTLRYLDRDMSDYVKLGDFSEKGIDRGPAPPDTPTKKFKKIPARALFGKMVE